MAVIQIPNLPAATSLSGSEQVEIVQAGVSVRTTTQAIANLAPTFGRYASIIDTTNQAFVSVGTAQIVNLGTLQAGVGFSLSAPGRVIIDTPATYSMTFSVELQNTDNATHYADIWLRYMGSDYPNSSTRITIPARKTASEYGYAVVTVNLIGTSVNPNDYIELWWNSDSTLVGIHTVAAGTSPVTPAAPGVILTLQQVA